ncbi:MAG: hypothetical protein QM750_23540 [Rubrivivax sp.]
MKTHARRLPALLAAAALATGLAPAQAQAQQPAADAGAPGLRLNGFGSIGVVDSRAPAGWGFRRDISQADHGGGTRADVDSRLGLQLNATASEQLEFVGQLLLKRRLPEVPAGDSVEWAFASIRPSPDWTLRIGRTNPDVFLLSDYRNVGFAYPWVRPEVAFYGSLSIYSLDGADLTRQWRLDGSLWKLKLLAGSGHTWAATLAGQPSALTRLRDLGGVVLSRESDGLTVRGTVARARASLDTGPGTAALSAALAQLAQLPLPAVQAQAQDLRARLALQGGHVTFIDLGAAYEGSRWLWSAELSTLQGSFAAGHTLAAYASLGRRLGAFTVYGVLAGSRTKGGAADVPAWDAALAPLLGPAAAAQAQVLAESAALSSNAARLGQSSVSLGVRWDLHPQAALKLQWDRYRVRCNGGLMFVGALGRSGQADVGSLVLDFVF